MNYLLDTNIISETIKKKANASVIDWLIRMPEDSLFISVITLGEIRKGIERLSEENKKHRLISWLESGLLNRFQNRIISINIDVADYWGHIHAKSSRSLPVLDSLIASTAIVNNLTLVTRNTKDFSDYPGLELVNPF